MSIPQDQSLGEVHSSVEIKSRGWRKLFSFLGPAYLISVGYMDPGNWATDIAGGSKYGYSLIWVLLMSNIMAIFLQGLSARLGIVRGRDLAQANRETYPKYINFILYILAEIAIAACDLAEVLGMAIGIQLLTGLPLIWAVTITILDTFLLLFLQRLGMRKMEAFIVTLVIIIAICFFIEILLAKPNAVEIAKGLLPSFPSHNAVYIAIGIIGATVMPHNLYLHSALVQTRKIDRSEIGIKQAIKYNRIDSIIALNIAFLVNAAILILAATVFFKTGNSHVVAIKEAYRLLPSFLGKTAPILFAVALIAAGQSSTITGTLAGQIVMEGYLSLRINPLLRRLITRLIAIVPAFFIIWYYGESKTDYLLILSQVILSLQLAFAIIPLIHFVSDKSKMGTHYIKLFPKIFAWTVAFVVIFLNVKMLTHEIGPIFETSSEIVQLITISVIIFFLLLLIYITLHPIFSKDTKPKEIEIHSGKIALGTLSTPTFSRIAIALDFSEDDNKIISYALSHGNKDAKYILIHVVESVSAKISGIESNDYETQKDRERMDAYIKELSDKNIKVEGKIGYKNRKKEIVRLANESSADMLVMGAHGHKGLHDFIYGQTVNAVRHQLKIPIMVVNL